MNIKTTIMWSRKLALVLAAPLIWFILTSGLFAFAIGSIASGAIKTTVAIAILYLVANKQVSKALEGRSTLIAAPVFFIIYLVAIGIFQLSDLFTTDLYLLGKIDIPAVISIASAIGYLIIVVITIFEFVRLMRSRAQV